MEQSLHNFIAKVLAGEASSDEKQALDDLCEKFADFAEMYAEARAIWEAAEALQPKLRVDVPAAWEKVHRRIQLIDPLVAAPPHPVARMPEARRRTLSLWSTPAAAAALVVGIGVALLFTTRQPSDLNRVIADVPGKVILLTDGTRVTLEKGATLSYPKTFDARSRTVSLDGVAFFEVAKDPAHPLTVDADKMQVTVLGTSFLVDENESKVAVRTGKVRVTDKADASDAVLLLPGEQAVLSEARFTKQPADVHNAYFQAEKISFSSKSFEESVQEISRILEVPVRIDASIDATGRSQSITYSSESGNAEKVLTDLCRITGYEWDKDGEGYRIFRAH